MTLSGLRLAPVMWVRVCRMARMASLKRMDHLRVVGSAFLTHGQVVYCGHDSRIKESYKGPCMLPPSPALYLCGTDAQASMLPSAPCPHHSDPWDRCWTDWPRTSWRCRGLPSSAPLQLSVYSQGFQAERERTWCRCCSCRQPLTSV